MLFRGSFAQTVAAGRGNRLDVHAALDTEAAVLRGNEAVAAGLADAVADPRSAFRAFAQSIHNRANLKSRAAISAHPSTPRKETSMNATTDPTGEANTEAPALQPETRQTETEAVVPVAATPPKLPEPVMPIPAPENAPIVSADAIRAEASEVAQVCAQAARLGVQIDAADAVKRGLKPEALRAQVLEKLAAQSDAASIVATAPAAAAAKDSPLIAAAKQAATDATR
jgi:hypothetical protein